MGVEDEAGDVRLVLSGRDPAVGQHPHLERGPPAGAPGQAASVQSVHHPPVKVSKTAA